jgi:hypothetical protein
MRALEADPSAVNRVLDPTAIPAPDRTPTWGGLMQYASIRKNVWPRFHSSKLPRSGCITREQYLDWERYGQEPT